MKKEDLPGDAVAEGKAPKKKRLSKVIDGTVLTITEGLTDTVLAFDFADLPEDIKALLGPFGLSNKIGDSAAGKKGQDAIDAMQKVFDGLMASNWSVRAPAATKITKGALSSGIDALPESERAAAIATLEALGIKL